MRILLLTSAYNGLCQRVHVELASRGYDVSIELFVDNASVREGVRLFEPDLILCPFLKQKIPGDVCKRHVCIIVHPGIKGDRGPSSLDWAIADGVDEWGVTAIQADADWDGGDIWAWSNFKMRCASKASLYRHEVTEASMQVILQTIERFERRDFVAEPLDYSRADVKGSWRPFMKQADRTIDWRSDPAATVIRKIHAADSSPGILDRINGQEYYLYGAYKEGELRGEPGAIIAQRNGAICRAAADGAVWISHLKKKDLNGQRSFKLPATFVLGDALEEVPESTIHPFANTPGETYRDIWYEERNAVGYLHFDFYNGAMSTEQCHRLRDAFVGARERRTKVIVLQSGPDFWSNGFHLNVIEAAVDPAEEAWRNINAIDDLVLAILETDNKLVVSAMQGNAAAGGVPLAVAADKVYARSGIVLNPHYQLMGLYGSEYWTYLLPRRVGQERALELTKACQPLGTQEAKAIGLIDDAIPAAAFRPSIIGLAESMANSPDYERQLSLKIERRMHDEGLRPLAEYRAAELDEMKINFYGDRTQFHSARDEFVCKALPKETPLRLAKHRQPLRRLPVQSFIQRAVPTFWRGTHPQRSAVRH